MTRARPTYLLSALAAMMAVGVAAPIPSTDRARYEAERQIGRKKKKPSAKKTARRYGRWLRFKRWVGRKGLENSSMGFRPHCSKHHLRFKHLRYRAVLEDETSGLRRSIKARAFACPTCLRAA